MVDMQLPRIEKPKVIFSFLIILSLIFLFLTSKHPAISAPPTTENTTVFTGQVIPAFIGGAYDPTEGFKQLAGLPIYVFAYDRFQGGAGIINNYAVRTQIRADGSFQAQGLPTGAHYGVYFPFRKNNGDVVRTDCRAPNVQPCVGSVITAEFRWPDPEDQIQDVFSYAYANAGGAVVNTQIRDSSTSSGYEEIKIEQAFLTSTTRLDIENSINVFPLIPKKAIRVTIGLGSTEQEASYEIYAQRVTKKMEQAVNQPQGLGVVNAPIIRGRTSIGTASGPFYYGTFQAYAPEGFYAITVWRTEGGSATYKEWDGISSVNSTNTGLGFEYVSKDWRDMIARAPNETSVAHRNYLISVWGLITDDRGLPMSSLNGGPLGLQDIEIGLKSDTSSAYVRKNDTQRNQGDVSRTQDFYTCCGAQSFTDQTVYGTYALYQYFPDNAIPTPLSERDWVYIHTPTYQKNPSSFKEIINGTHGPARINLTATKSARGHTSGYDTGIYLKINLPGGNEASLAKVRVFPLTDDKDIAAKYKFYYTNRLGEVHISDNDLKVELEYVLAIKSTNFIEYKMIPYLDSADGVDGDNKGYAQDTTTLAFAEPLPYAYKILGVLPVPFTHAQAQEYVPIKVTFQEPPNAQLTSAEIYIRDGTGRFCGEPECKMPATITGNEFNIEILRSVSGEEEKKECIADAWVGGIGPDCDFLGEEFNPNNTYQIRIKFHFEGEDIQNKDPEIEKTVMIDAKGHASPPFLEFNFSNCDLLGHGFTLNPLTALSDFFNVSSCKLVKFFGDSVGSIFGTVQRVAFETQPVNKTQGVVFLWNIMRGIVNVLFILFLVIIGIMTILRYEPKSFSPGILIPRFFLAVLFANLSLYIVQIFIDINNVATQSIFGITARVLQNVSDGQKGAIVGAVGAAGAGWAVLSAVSGLISGMGFSFVSAILSAPATGGVSLIPLLIPAVGMILTILIFIFGLILLFFTRYAVLWVLTVIAPIAFALNIFPSFSDLFKQWWNTLIAYTLMQTVVAFVISLGLLLLTVAGGENGFLNGLGMAITGIIILVSAIKIPAVITKTMKAAIGAPAGAPEALGKWKQGFMKDTLTEENLMGAGKTADARGRPALLGGLAGVLSGRYGQEERFGTAAAKSKALDAQSAIIHDIKQDLKRAADVRRMNMEFKVEKQHPADAPQTITEPALRNVETFLKNAPDTERVAYSYVDAAGVRRTSAPMSARQVIQTIKAAKGVSDEEALYLAAKGVQAVGAKKSRVETQADFDQRASTHRSNRETMQKWAHATKV